MCVCKCFLLGQCSHTIQQVDNVTANIYEEGVTVMCVCKCFLLGQCSHTIT